MRRLSPANRWATSDLSTPPINISARSAAGVVATR
jgi:hypothetical protein